MSKAVFIATIEPNSGKSIVVLGMMRMLLGKIAKVGYFRPIIDDPAEGEVDNHINTVISHFELDINFKNAFAFTRSEVLQKYNQGKSGEIIDGIIRKYKNLEEKFDFILVEGTDFSDEGSIIEFDINVIIAKNLGIPAVIVASGIDKKNDEILGNLKLAFDTFNGKDVEVLALVANKVTPGSELALKTDFIEHFGKDIDSIVIPKIDMLNNPTIKEIVNELDGNVLFGKEYLNNQAGNFGVGAMQLRNYLTHLKDNSLVITPGDRADIILGVLQANISDNYPKISGIILTGGIIPEKSILKLIEGVSISFPIISVPSGTFSITNQIGSIKSKIYLDNIQKIDTSISTFERYVDEDRLSDKLITFTSEGLTPKMFQYYLLKRALQHKKHIVLPEGSDERILRAVSRLLASDVVEITLIGDERKIRNKATKLDISIDFEKVAVVNPTTSVHYDDYVQTFYELRKHKI